MLTRDEDGSRAQKRERRRKAKGVGERERRELDYRSVGTRRFDQAGYHRPQNYRRPAASDGTGCVSERATTEQLAGLITSEP